MREVGREELHLLAQPAGADAEEEAAAGEQVERGDLERGVQRVALRDEADAGRHPQLLRDRGGRGERGEAVGQLGVGPRHLPVLRERVARLVLRGDDRMLGHPERLDASRLAGTRQIRDRERPLGHEHEDAEVHAATSCRRAWPPWPS